MSSIISLNEEELILLSDMHFDYADVAIFAGFR